MPKSERYQKIDASLPDCVTPDDEVLIIRGNNSRHTWHFPDGEDNPICATKSNKRDWSRVKLIVVGPTYELCSQCAEKKGLN